MKSRRAMIAFVPRALVFGVLIGLSTSHHALTLTSAAFSNGGVIPDPFTFNYGLQCSGSNWSPPLSFTDIPSGTQSLAITVVDPTGGNWLHWKAWNIHSATASLAYNAAATATFSQSANDFGLTGYGGPCPPTPNHQYVFKLYALNQTFSSEPSITQLESASLAVATLTGTRSPSDRLSWSPPTPQMSLRDAIYRYGQPFSANGEKTLVGVDCDVFQVVLDLNDGQSDIGMGSGNTLTAARAAQTTYQDTIRSADAMFAYALYGSEPVKSFTFKDRNSPTATNTVGTGTAFGYCYSTKEGARVYFQENDICRNTYGDGHTNACTAIDNGSGSAATTTNMTLRDAAYFYNQPLNGKGDKILVGENCDVFQLLLDVGSGYTDLTMSESATVTEAVAAEAVYPDRISSDAAMFSYALYANQPTKLFRFNDKAAPTSPTQTGTATVFGYCYSSQSNARVYLREMDTCTDKLSNNQTVAATGCDR